MTRRVYCPPLGEQMGTRRIVMGLVATVGCIIVALGIAGVWWAHRDWAAYYRTGYPFDALKAELRPLADEASPTHRVYDLSLSCSAGFRTEGRLHLPRRAGPYRALLLLGGLGTGKKAAALVPESYYERGFAVLALEWHLDGVPKPWPGMSDLDYVRYHRVIVDTVFDLKRAAHWLSRHEEIVSDQVACVAVSLGAFAAPAAAAASPDIDAMVIAYGSGSFRKLAERNVSVKNPWFKALLVRGASFLLTPLEPTRFIAALAPRPLYMVASSSDRTIPREAVQEVFDAASEPKTLCWVDGEHLHPSKSEVITELATGTLAWLERVFPRKAQP